MNKIIAIVGMCGSGKSVASELLEQKDTKKYILVVSQWKN